MDVSKFLPMLTSQGEKIDIAFFALHPYIQIQTQKCSKKWIEV